MSKRKKISKKTKIIIICILSGLLVAGLVFVLILALVRGFRVANYEETIAVDYKSELKKDEIRVCYGSFFSCEPVTPTVEGDFDPGKLGSYHIKYIYTHDGESMSLEQTVEVKDLSPPNITVSEGDLIACPTGKIQGDKIKAFDELDGDLTSKITYEVVDGKVVASAKDEAGNIAKTSITVKAFEDKEPPVIKLNGEQSISVYVGDKYEDQGAVATDNCDDDVKVSTEGSVDTSKAGTYEISYKAKDAAGNEAVAKRTVFVKQKATGYRTIYLTFDDGPSEYTNYLLDILKKYNVKVTFFVTGAGDDATILRQYQEGHQIALHTYSHTYSSVYRSDDDFMADLRWIQERVEKITGYKSWLMRFPGGSSNTVSRNYSRGIMSRLTKRVENEGYHYFDWNVSSGDAGGATTSDAVYGNVVGSLKEGSSIVLQHDTKKFSIDAVERIIQYANANGYTFATLNETSPGAHHGVNN